VSAVLLDLLPRAVCVAVDVSAPACALTRATAAAAGVGARLDAVRADFVGPLAARLAGAVDVLAWNPPYVPTPADEVPRVGDYLADAGLVTDPLPAAWAGGERGRDVIDRVLPLIPRVLRRPGADDAGGVAYILLVEENAPDEVAALFETLGMRADKILTRRAANELLHVLRVQWARGSAE
jgi:release factor glutamine methyltransferase